MREQLSIPEYDPYSADHSVLSDPLIASFGEQALKSEQYILEEEIAHESTQTDLAFIGGLATAPPNDKLQAWAEEQYNTRNLSQVAHKAKSEQAKSANRLEKYTSFLRDDLDGARARISRLPDIEKEELSEKIDQTLDVFAVARGIEPQNIAFRQWKRHAEQAEGRPLSWAEWIARPSDAKDTELGTVDRQLTNFLHWNQHHYNATNMSDEFNEELREKREHFDDGLYKAVKADKLAPELYIHFSRRPQYIMAGEVLDEMLFFADGYSVVGKDEIVMSHPVRPGTYVHERVHKLGNFGDMFWNESATQLIADVVDEENGSPKHESGYDPGVNTLKELMNMTNVSTKEMSYYYARNDLEGMLEEMGSHIGRDLIADYNKIKKHVEAMSDVSYEMQGLTQGLVQAYVDYIKTKRP